MAFACLGGLVSNEALLRGGGGVIDRPPPTVLADTDCVPMLASRVANLRRVLIREPGTLVPWLGTGLSARHGFPGAIGPCAHERAML